MSNRRDVDLHLVGHDDTGKMAATAGRNLDRIKKKLNRFTADTDKSLRKRGFDGANSFVQSFLRGITLGRIGDQAAAKLSPSLSRAGTRIGGVFAAALAGAALVQAGNLILAGLPLILGPAILLAPLLRLFKTEEKAVDRLKRKATKLLDFIAKPLKAPFLRILEAAGNRLESVAPLLQKFVKELAPGFEKLVNGALGGIVSFVEALEPAMPGINAGMKEWGKQAPKIGKHIGEAIAAILKDPEKVKNAVKNTADLLKNAADAAVDLAGALVTISTKYGELAAKVDRFEQSTGAENGGPLGGMWNAVKRNGKKIIGYLGPLPDRMREKMRPVEAKLSGVARRAYHGVINWFKRLPGRAADAVRNLWGRMKGAFDRVVERGKQRAREARDGVARFLKRIPAAAAAAVSGLWGAMKGAFQTALDGVIGFASRIAAKVREIIGLKAKASGNPGGGGGGSSSWAAGTTWSPVLAPAGAYRTGGPTVNVAAPEVSTRVYLDSREIRAVSRSVILDEQRRAAYRARIGSRR